MNFASKKANIFSKDANEVNGNLFTNRFDDLRHLNLLPKNMPWVMIECASCQAVVSRFSSLKSGKDYLAEKESLLKQASRPTPKAFAEDVATEGAPTPGLSADHIKKTYIEVGTMDQVWVCEFCGTHNKVQGNFMKPETSNVFYFHKDNNNPIQPVLPAPSSLIKTSVSKKPKPAKKSGLPDPIAYHKDDIGVKRPLMPAPHPYLDEKKRCGRSNTITKIKAAPIDPLMGFSIPSKKILASPAKPARPQTSIGLPDDSKAYTLIIAIDISGSMKGKKIDAVKIALEREVMRLTKTNPKVKVGIITFDSKVTLLDTRNDRNVEIKEKDILFKEDDLFELGQKNCWGRFDSAIESNYKKLLPKIKEVKPTGNTALGPALVTSIGVASKTGPGTKILLCTDGLSNVGLGNVEDKSKQRETEQFYDHMGSVAKDLGVSVNVIALEGGACSINNLSRLAIATNGKLIRVKPDSLEKDLSKIVDNVVLATNATIYCRIHKGLRFKNEDAQNLSRNGSTAHRTIGNITSNIEAMFEYNPKPADVLKKEGIDFKKMKALPFQTSLVFTDPYGNKMIRVMTEMQEIASSELEANKQVNYGLLGVRAQQFQAKYSMKGQYADAEKCSMKYDKYMASNALYQAPKQQEKMKNWQKKNQKVSMMNNSRANRMAQKIVDRNLSDTENNAYQEALFMGEDDLDL